MPTALPPVSNLDGDEPFVPLEDILKPNEAYWPHLDAILEAAEKRGLFVSIAALWIRWGGQDKEGWRYQLTEDNAQAYGQFLGQRCAARKNILWIVVVDANPGEKQKAISLMAQGSPFPPKTKREFIPPGKQVAGNNDWMFLFESSASSIPSKSGTAAESPRKKFIEVSWDMPDTAAHEDLMKAANDAPWKARR